MTVIVTVTNLGRKRCTVPTGNCLPQVVITDGAGNEVWNRATTQVNCVQSGSHPLRVHGLLDEVVRWDGMRCAGRDPRTCPGTPVPPGTYTVSATWGGVASSREVFAVTPS